MTAPTLAYSWDGYLQTPCPSWCWHGCDGTLHGSAPAHIAVQCHPHPMVINVIQPTDEAEPKISLVDSQCVREDRLTADEAEHLAHVLLDHVKIVRAHAAEAGR